MYTIKWDTWEDTDGRNDFMIIRRSNIKHTYIVWVNVGWEVAPEMLGCIWHKRAPILFFLN